MIEELRKKLGEVKENVSLSSYTTFKIGGPARYFYIARDSRELLAAVLTAEKFELPYFILGWGSNLLIADGGFPGLAIKATSDNIDIKGEEILCETGVNLSLLVGRATQAGLTGLEFAAGIPGTVGGAARNNAGAYGSSFSDLVTGLEVYKEGKTTNFGKEDMQYHYRSSILKYGKGIVLSVKMKLKKSSSKKVQQEVIRIIKQRNAKLPLEPSAGCIFKNVELDTMKIDPKRVIKALDITEKEWKEATKFGKLPVGYILERLDLKGKTIGGCQISDKHCGFIVNVENAKAEHVMMLISDIKMRVRNELGIQLEEEVQYLGF